MEHVELHDCSIVVRLKNTDNADEPSHNSVEDAMTDVCGIVAIRIVTHSKVDSLL